jgi:tetratricopeptide (TPR) repeat protein
MAGSFDGSGFRGIAVGDDGKVRKINSRNFASSNPFAAMQAEFGGGAAGAATSPTAIGPGGFDPFAFVFGQSMPHPAAAAAIAGDFRSGHASAARRAFRRGQVERALQMSEQAVAANSHDMDALQLQALAYFALGQYERAANAAHTVLDTGAGWDWATLRQLYPDTETYLAQLRALQGHTRQEPESAASHLLLAYHYLVLQKVDEARGELLRVKNLQPGITLVDRMLATLPPSLESP